MKYIVLFILICSLGTVLNASDSIAGVRLQPPVAVDGGKQMPVAARLDSTKFEALQLPPLHVFLESVVDHPSLQIYQTYKDEEDARLKSTKREWLDYFRVVGQAQYGHNGVVLSPEQGVGNQVFGFSPRMYYNVGVSLSVPLGNLSSRSQRIKEQEARLKRVGYQYEISLEERKLRILDAYNQVVQQIAVLKAKADAAALYNAQMKISESDYINGKISITDLSLERARRSTSVVNYEEGKASLQNAITLLEMLTNVKITK